MIPSYKQITKMYLPLLFSRALIVSEFSICSLAIAKFPNPELNLAAMGGVILPIAFLYECPIYDLITSSNVLSKDWESYKILRKFFLIFCLLLTILGIIIFCTPINQFIILNILGATPEIYKIAQPALFFILSWPWTVGYRRLLQGVLIRHKRAKLVGLFSAGRILSLLVCLFIFHKLNIFSAALSATISLTIGCLVEAILVHLQLIKMYQKGEIEEKSKEEVISLKFVRKFYMPLALSALVAHLSLSIGSWGMFRMADSITSLTVWGAIGGSFWVIAAMGHSFTDIVILYAKDKASIQILYRYSYILCLISIFCIFLIGIFPSTSSFYLETMLGLKDKSLIIAKASFVFGLLIPTTRIINSLPYSILLKNNSTTDASTAIIINIFFLATSLAIGVKFFPDIIGIYYYLFAATFSFYLQYAWMQYKVKKLF